MAKPKEITIRWLKVKEACEPQVELFRKTFGKKAELSRSNLVIAKLAGLDTEWLAAELLDVVALLLDTGEARDYVEAKDAAECAFQKAKDSAWRAYQEATEAARLSYEEATDPKWRAYEEVRAAARQDYDGAVETSLQAYKEARAAAWLAYEAAKNAAWPAYKEVKEAARLVYAEATIQASRVLDEALANALADRLGLD